MFFLLPSVFCSASIPRGARASLLGVFSKKGRGNSSEQCPYLNDVFMGPVDSWYGMNCVVVFVKFKQQVKI